MAFIAGIATVDTASSMPAGGHPNHQVQGPTQCMYAALPLGGTPITADRVSIGSKDGAVPMQFYSGNVSVPAPVPGVPTALIQACPTSPRYIEPVINKKVKVNGMLVAVIGDHSDTNAPQTTQRILTGPSIYPKINIASNFR